MAETQAMALLIRGGSVLNPFPPFEARPASVRIAEGRIVDIGEIPESGDERIVDATGLTIIPGLINLHVHITRRHLHLQPVGVPFRQGAPAIENLPDELRVLWGLRNAWTELAEGATTIRDAGSKHHVSIRLRDGLRNGIFPGPRVLVSGEPVAITGGHESHRYSGAREADGPDEVRKAVREQLRAGADWIKLMASAGIGGMPYREHPRYTEFTFEELSAGAEEAHKRGRRVLAHAMSDESVRFCIDCGVDTVEHGVLMREETVEVMKENGVGFVPTISGISNVYAREKAAGNNDFAQLLQREVLEPHRKVVMQAIEHGVRVGTGSDTLGSMSDEIALLVACGMSSGQALAAATIDGAVLLRMEDELGSIELGKRADLVMIAGDPIVDVDAYHNVREVVYGGELLSATYPKAWLNQA